MNIKRRIGLAATALVSATAAVVTMSAPASADSGYATKTCDPTEMYNCLTLFYNSGSKGSSTVFESSIHDFAPYKYLNSGAGQGQNVKNNAAAAWFWMYELNGTRYGIIYYNGNCAGKCDAILNGAVASKLANTYNEDASYTYLVNSTGGCHLFS